VAICLLAAGTTACGGTDADGSDAGLASARPGADDASPGERVVEVTMRDTEFAPDQVEVAAGETVRFVFTNEGAVPHDGVIGDDVAQQEHELSMRAGEMAVTGHEHPTGSADDHDQPTGDLDHEHPVESPEVHDHPTGDLDHEHPDATTEDHEHPGGGTDGHAAGPHVHGTSASGPGAAIAVGPGGTGDLTYTFAAGEEIEIGCHERGHYAAGMRLAITVADR
jgi:uncharacterized cupredoxin-like copper-binding protein